MTYKHSQNSLPAQAIAGVASRIDSIDFLRGAVMIIMAIDHVRDYFHVSSFLHDPTNASTTTVGLFMTRWITHICAPTFVLLAGTSAYIMEKKQSKKDVSMFLLKRGLWLILIQITIIRFGWNFDPFFHYNSLSIISLIGICMIGLSGMIHLPFKAIFAIAVVVIAGHNLFDGLSFEEGTVASVLWSFLHIARTYDLGRGYSFTIVYPIIAWIGVISLGYCFGRLYGHDYSVERRKKVLLTIGAACLLVFVILRYLNFYGDPTPWAGQGTAIDTFISFLNVQKYPPSFLFLCGTLGMSILMLGFIEGRSLDRVKWITLFGSVALFYYVVHIYVIHILAMVAAVATGHPWQLLIYDVSPTVANPQLFAGYGFSLVVVYMVWILVVAILYPCCVYWKNFKTRNKAKWWVSYV
jgi:uncharacterized membrane protein